MIRLFLVCLLLTFFSFDAFANEVTRPNILLITADNLGYGDVGCFGNHVIKTPQLDQLAKEGVRCTDFYTASPTCTVSRATLLTGRYPQRIRLNHQLNVKENYGKGLRTEELLIPHFLKQQGYKSACFGKWNLGFGKGYRPTERGFDQFFGFAAGNIDYEHHVYAGQHDLWRDTTEVFEKGYSTDLFANAACEFIDKNKKRPFFIYLPFNAPHFPGKRNKQPGQENIWQAPDIAFKAYGYDPDTRDEQRRYYAVVTALDTAIGRVLKQLKDSRLEEKTLVIWYSDNGAFMLKDRGLEVASNKPLQNGGVTLWEGGIRVPCIIRYPKQIKAGTVSNRPLISLDILPTLVDIAGGTLPKYRTFDGNSMFPLLNKRDETSPRTFFFQYRKYSAVRRGKYKLLRTKPTGKFMLFDLEKDIGEKHNIANDQVPTTTKLKQAYLQWEKDIVK